jgi:hypothetical protein
MGPVPQLIVSAVYVAMNYQLTAMVQLRDWTRLAIRKQPLRVSAPEPHSAQVSTYWLSPPYGYSMPLLISSIVLGWLVSQTLFSYRYILYLDDGSFYKGLFEDLPVSEYGRVQHGLGYSVLGIILSMIFGSVIFCVSVALGFSRCAPGLPLGPTNSMVIAAACHPPANEKNAAKKAVRWGVVATANDATGKNVPGHCTITSAYVEDPVGQST